MPAYAGFRDVQDYLDTMYRRHNTNSNQVSEALKWRRNYISGVYTGQFIPSPARCDIISDFFSADRHILRVLVGHETPPPAPTERLLREIYDLAASLDEAGRREALKCLTDLVKH